MSASIERNIDKFMQLYEHADKVLENYPDIVKFIYHESIDFFQYLHDKECSKSKVLEYYNDLYSFFFFAHKKLNDMRFNAGDCFYSIRDMINNKYFYFGKKSIPLSEIYKQKKVTIGLVALKFDTMETEMDKLVVENIRNMFEQVTDYMTTLNRDIILTHTLLSLYNTDVDKKLRSNEYMRLVMRSEILGLEPNEHVYNRIVKDYEESLFNDTGKGNKYYSNYKLESKPKLSKKRPLVIEKNNEDKNTRVKLNSIILTPESQVISTSSASTLSAFALSGEDEDERENEREEERENTYTQHEDDDIGYNSYNDNGNKDNDNVTVTDNVENSNKDNDDVTVNDYINDNNNDNATVNENVNDNNNDDDDDDNDDNDDNDSNDDDDDDDTNDDNDNNNDNNDNNDNVYDNNNVYDNDDNNDVYNDDDNNNDNNININNNNNNNNNNNYYDNSNNDDVCIIGSSNNNEDSMNETNLTRNSIYDKNEKKFIAYINKVENLQHKGLNMVTEFFDDIQSLREDETISINNFLKGVIKAFCSKLYF